MEEAQDTKRRLEAYLKARFPQREGLSVVDLKGTAGGLEGGFSYKTYLFTVSWLEAHGPVSESLVLRMEPAMGCVPPYDIRPQYEVLKRVHGTGVPVPKVHWLEMDSKVLGHPFFVMEKMDGEVLFSYCQNHPEHLERLMKDFLGILAKIHGLDWQALGLSVLGVPENDRQYAEKEIARWHWVVEDSQYSPQPVMAELFAWLKRNIPRAERTTLCHGDYNIQNVLTHEGRIVAALDWEMVGIGDPMSDLAWCCVLIPMRLGSACTEADVIRIYEEMAGVKVSMESLFFWKVLNSVKVADNGFAGTKVGIESKELDMRFLSNFAMLPPLVLDAAARMLGF